VRGLAPKYSGAGEFEVAHLVRVRVRVRVT